MLQARSVDDPAQTFNIASPWVTRGHRAQPSPEARMASTAITTQSPPTISTQHHSVPTRNKMLSTPSQKSSDQGNTVSALLAFLHSINYWNSFWVLAVPAFGFWLASSTPLLWQTAVWSVAYYFVTGLGITAGEFGGFFLSWCLVLVCGFV